MIQNLPEASKYYGTELQIINIYLFSLTQVPRQNNISYKDSHKYDFDVFKKGKYVKGAPPLL